MRKTVSFLLLFCITILVASCSPSESQASITTQTPASATAVIKTPAAQTSASSIASSETLTGYSNSELGFSMGIPSVMTNSRDQVDEKSLILVAADKDFVNNLFVIVSENVDGTTMDQYRRASPLWTYVQNEAVASEDIRLSGVDFWKVLGSDEADGVEMVKALYIAIHNGLIYEITITLTKEYYDANTAVFEDVEKSIVIAS